jgi:hypothetical protein
MEQLNVDQVPPREAPAAQEVAPVVSNELDVAIPQVEKPEEPVAEAPVENLTEAEERAAKVSEEPVNEEAQPALKAPPNEPEAREAPAEPAQKTVISPQSPPTDDVLVARLGEVLKTVDLGVTTGKICCIQSFRMVQVFKCSMLLLNSAQIKLSNTKFISFLCRKNVASATGI